MKKILPLLTGVILITIGIYTAVYFYNQKDKPVLYTGPTDKINVGIQVEYGTLILIAKQQGYFDKNGLDITIKNYSSGAPAFTDLLNGTVDIIDAAEFVGVRNSFANEDFKMIGSIGTTADAWELLARKDHGITQITDLRGKKIGLPRKTLGEFFLGNTLTLHNIPAKDVTLVDLPPDALMDAFTKGTVDAVIIFEPHVFNLKQTMGENAIAWPGQSGRPNYIGLYATGHVIRNNPDAVDRFVKSLVEAQTYLETTNGAVEQFMKDHFHYSDAYIKAVLPKFDFFVGLEQPMIILMEDEARWMIDNNLTQQKTIPNYLNLIYFEPLDKANPQAITIIR